jgi:hypothetical protein
MFLFPQLFLHAVEFTLAACCTITENRGDLTFLTTIFEIYVTLRPNHIIGAHLETIAIRPNST